MNDLSEQDMKTGRIVKMVNSSDIYFIKQLVTEIIKIINDPDSNAGDLKNIIKKGHPLTSGLLKLTNFTLYSYPKTIYISNYVF